MDGSHGTWARLARHTTAHDEVTNDQSASDAAADVEAIVRETQHDDGVVEAAKEADARDTEDARDSDTTTPKGQGIWSPPFVIVLVASLLTALIMGADIMLSGTGGTEDPGVPSQQVADGVVADGTDGDPSQDEGSQGTDGFLYADEVLGVYEVRVDGVDEELRSQNLQAVARALNGLVLEPGDTLSFNEVVGEPQADQGYADVAGVESVSDALDQVATALHVASLKAGLSVPVRNAHVIAVDYAPLGLDAAIAWGLSDLEVRNDTGKAVTVQVTVSGTSVIVSILGTPVDPTVTYDVLANVVKTYARVASDVYADPLAQGLLASDEVNFSVTETYLETYRNGELETRELIYADTYQLPVDAESVAPAEE